MHSIDKNTWKVRISTIFFFEKWSEVWRVTKKGYSVYSSWRSLSYWTLWPSEINFRVQVRQGRLCSHKLKETHRGFNIGVASLKALEQLQLKKNHLYKIYIFKTYYFQCICAPWAHEHGLHMHKALTSPLLRYVCTFLCSCWVV